MNKKKIFTVAVALVLIAVIGVGTLAFLTSDSGTVTNTFVPAGGGNIIKGGDVDNYFILDESTVTSTAASKDASTGAITPASWSLGNPRVKTDQTYDYLMPGVTVPKDPKVTVTIEKDITAYLFVKVEGDSTKLDFTVDPANWTALGDSYPNVYAYAGGVILGDGSTAVEASILKDNQMKIKDNAVPAVPSGSTSTDKTFGSLVVSAYACQAQGFDTAAAAWGATFGAPATP